MRSLAQVSRGRLFPGMLLCAVVLFVCPQLVSAQEGADLEPPEQLTATDRVTLAVSSPAYPVTPGDTYRLTYNLPSGVEGTTVFTVNSNYELRLAHFGRIDARNLTLSQLQTRAEEAVMRYYPNAYPRLELAGTGLFRVFVSGAVEPAGWVYAWGLTHLSSVIAGRLSEAASRRAVERIDTGGNRETYDLFSAERLGIVAEDPFVQPGDRISVPYSDRRVSILGEVRRPGEYDLLPEEGFDELLTRLAGGPTSQADLQAIELTRRAEETGEQDGYRTFDSLEGSPGRLRDRDIFFVPSVNEDSPVVYIVIGRGDETTTMRHRLRDGDTLFTVMQAVLLRPGNTTHPVGEDTVSPESLALARIQRAGDTARRVNLEALVFGGNQALDMRLQPGDTIVVP
ncbi:MAG: SLBB domain-containing protein [Spirochaetia bacterium]